VDRVAIRCQALVKRYGGLTAVAGLDLEVGTGECFGLLGPNGAGKTTTVEILEGLAEPDSGSVEILGCSWTGDARALRERLGVQLQETKLPEKLTVLETLRLFRSFYRRGQDPADALRTVDLVDKANVWVRRLSGGQRQRLSLACALVGRPEVLFLDEPTSGLDPQSRRQIWDVIGAFRRQGGTVLITTHYMEEAQRLCDRVAIIDRGRTLALGTPAELIAGLGAEHVVEFQVDRDPDDAALAGLAGVRAVGREDGLVRLTVGEVHRTLPALLDELRRQDLALRRLQTHHATLEDVFVALTGRHLREG
jgi:ABC-2 type transport system ATP-binding protein